MRKFAIILGITLGLWGSTSAFGQGAPRIDIFGGYSYVNFDTNGLATRQSANGWEASVSGDVNKWFAVEGDFGGYYKTYTVDATAYDLGIFNVDVHDYSYLGGPRINLGPIFFHALIGGDTLTGSASGFSASQSGFASAFGGGVQWRVAPHTAVRASVDYAMTRHNIFGGPAYTQNNVRVSAGIVYTFGGLRGASEAPVAIPPPQTGPTSEAALLGVSGHATELGFTITSVRAGSPAAHLFLNPGDIVTRIDDREVHSSVEIESAIAASPTGMIKVSCLIQTPAVGMAAPEREVKVR